MKPKNAALTRKKAETGALTSQMGGILQQLPCIIFGKPKSPQSKPRSKYKFLSLLVEGMSPILTRRHWLTPSAWNAIEFIKCSTQRRVCYEISAIFILNNGRKPDSDA
jgi:hypothetical protein